MSASTSLHMPIHLQACLLACEHGALTSCEVKFTVWLVIFARDLFLRFSRTKEPFAKIKTTKNFTVHVRSERTAFQSLAYLYSHQQKCVSKCAFDGYH